MHTVRRDIELRATPSSVFSLLDDFSHLAERIPHLTAVSSLDPTQNSARSGKYTGRILGVPIAGTIQGVDYQKPSRIVWRFNGDLSGTLRWYLSALDSGRGTQFTYAATLRPPGPRLLRSVLAPMIHARTRHLIERVVLDVKKSVE